MLGTGGHVMNELIKQARELCDAATPGPWIVYESGNTVKSHMVITRSPWKCVTGGISPKTHNAAFIAASRILIPQLCDALEAETTRAEKSEAERDTYKTALQALHINIDLLKP